jgi:hypothetical protein
VSAPHSPWFDLAGTRVILRVGSQIVNAAATTYIIQRQDRFYVVAYDGLDPLTGRERRRWHPAGHDRADAEAIARQLDDHRIPPLPTTGSTTLASFPREMWIPLKRRQVRASTAYRYAWFTEHYIAPAIGDVPLRRLRVDHLDRFYQDLATVGGRRGVGLSPKTVLEVHIIVRAALDAAVDRGLIERESTTDVAPIRRSATPSSS